jgi:hypothetical protein
MELPPPPALRDLIQRYARLRTRLAEDFGERPLVLPTAEFFPDEFTPDTRGVKRLVARMKQHAGLADIPTKTRVVGDLEEAGCGTGGCGTGGGGAAHSAKKQTASCSTGCGPSVTEPEEPVERLVDEGNAWRIQIPAGELGHPVVLTTQVARALAYVFLLETQSEAEPLEAPLDVTADLAAVGLGFGALLMQGAYIYQKGCGGPRVGQVTKLGLPELATATALFAAVQGCAPRAALRELETTQAAVFREAVSWTESNPTLIASLRSRPEAVARGEFALADTQPWLLRALGIGKKKKSSSDLDAALSADPSALEDMLSALPQRLEQRPRRADPERDELRALVDEALVESTGAPPR